MARRVKVEVGSGNIFTDLGLPDADTHFLKAQIVSEIYRITVERKLTQAQAGKLMDITQPEVSRMFQGELPGILHRAADGLPDELRSRCRDRGEASQEGREGGADHVQSPPSMTQRAALKRRRVVSARPYRGNPSTA
jgi:predicted XRE-type DNA-binding protein